MNKPQHLFSVVPLLMAGWYPLSTQAHEGGGHFTSFTWGFCSIPSLQQGHKTTTGVISDRKRTQLWDCISSHNIRAIAVLSVRQKCYRCVDWAAPGTISQHVCAHCAVEPAFLSLSLLGSDSMQENTSIISGSGPHTVLWLRLWKLLLSKPLVDLPVVFRVGLQQAWWDTEPFINHESDRNSSSFTNRIWLWLGFSPQKQPWWADGHKLPQAQCQGMVLWANSGHA